MMTLDAVLARPDIPDRIKHKLFQTENDCWQWHGATTKDGYTQITFWSSKKKTRLHRFMFQCAFGAMPSDMVVDHKCRNRSCCNPSHLKAVTPVVNTLENSNSLGAVYSARLACKSGHEFTPENTYVLSQGGRGCLQCKAIRQAKYRAKIYKTVRGPRNSNAVLAERERVK